MILSFSRSLPSLFAAACLGLALAVPALAADSPYASEEQARQALAILQSDAPPSEKAVACKRLAIYGGPEAVPALARLLDHPQLASWARIPLEVIPGPAADNALRDALQRVQGNLLVGVINSIGVRGDSTAVDPLLVHLRDADPEIASAAAIALGRIGGIAATGALENSLATAPIRVRSAAAEGLILGAERASDSDQNAEAIRLYDIVRRAEVPQQRALEATRGAILARKEAGLPILLETLRSSDPEVFNIGLRTVREMPGQPITEALATEVHQLPPARQGLLLLALTDRQDDAVAPALIRAVNQGSKSLRLVAIGVLERQGTAASLPALFQAGIDPDPEVAQAAQTALARLPGKSVEAYLAAYLPRATGKSRLLMVELAGQRRVTSAVPELFKTVHSSGAELRHAAVVALGETVQPGDLGALADLLSLVPTAEELDEVEAALDSACHRLPDKQASAAPLLARLPSSPAPARSALLRVLGTVGTPEALQAVQSSLSHADDTVRDAAFRVLADWPESNALPALLGVLRSPANDTQGTLALRGAVRLLRLGDLSPAQSLLYYRDLLALARRADDRKLVLSGLGTVPDPAAIQLVQPLVADAEVRQEAESALLNIAAALAGSAPSEAKALATQLQTSSQDASIREQAAQVLQRMDQFGDFITTWQFAGAYTLATGESGSLFAKEFPPEKGDPTVAWKPLRAGTQEARPWMLDLLATKTGEARCAGYVRTWVHSSIAQPARVEFGTDDGHKFWCNGEPIAQADRGGAAVPGEFKTVVSLRQGWNLLVLKVVQDTGPWEFCLRLRTSTGEKLEGLRIQALPPES